MEPQILLAQLRALLERAPDFNNYSPTSREHLVWLGQAHALVTRWSHSNAIAFQSSCDLMHSSLMRDGSLAQIFGTVHRAIADLELKIPVSIEVSFGAGQVYDFFNALNKVVASAEKSLFVIDPYMHYSIFDQYIQARQPSVMVRLLCNHDAKNLLPASNKYISQHGAVLEIRESKLLHDRVIFVDDSVCWLIGQSLKDAAKAKPTYLVPLPPDVVSEKLNNYETIWHSAAIVS